MKSSAPLTAASALDGYVKADYAGPQFDLNSIYWTNPAVGDEIVLIPRGLPAGSSISLMSPPPPLPHAAVVPLRCEAFR